MANKKGSETNRKGTISKVVQHLTYLMPLPSAFNVSEPLLLLVISETCVEGRGKT
jgi:hypothetical protein